MAAQRWWWEAVYEDGIVLHEEGTDREGARFEDVERDRLARFGLFCAATGREVVGLDCATGVFRVYGHEVTFRLGDLPLTGRAGVSYRDLVQYKSAHSDWRPGGGTGTVVDAHHIGYRVVLPEALFRVVFRLDARTRGVRIEAWVTLTQPLAWSKGAFAVLVDGIEDVHGVVFTAPLGREGAR